MLLAERRTPRTAQRGRLDHAAITLLRLVADERGWDLETAGNDLRDQLDDERLLHLLRARVAHAMLARPTHTDRRALATLDRALRDPALRTYGDRARQTREALAHG